MKILAIGDVVGRAALGYVKVRLWGLRRELGVDFVVANGENVCDIHGIDAEEADTLFSAGVDLITTGNHVFSRRTVYSYLDNTEAILRPCNFSPEAPGKGYTILSVDGWRILCINAMGRTYMEPLASPFETVDKILAREEGNYDLALLDFHAEATSEKLAMAHYFDGRIQVIFGTHTHVATADECILPKGSGYITDLGMTGPVDSILGTEKEAILRRFLTAMPQRFVVAEGEIAGTGAIFEVAPSSRRVLSVKRVSF